MNYTLHQLQIFLKVAETQSVTKAAEELFLSQPGVSIQLRNFQAQFTQPLTEVVGRKIYITDFGRQIADLAANILAEVDNLNRLATLKEGQLFGKLKIGIVSTAKYVMPFFLSDFLKLHPGVELQMDVTNRAGVLENLAENTLDFALVSILPATLRLESIPLMANRLYLVGPASATVGDRPLPAAALAELPLIYREAGSGTRATMEQFILKHGLSTQKKIELTSNEAVKQAVIAGLGYSIMPLIGIRSALQNRELAIIPIEGLPLETTWNLIWLKEKQFSKVALAYQHYVVTVKDQIIAQRFAWADQY